MSELTVSTDVPYGDHPRLACDFIFPHNTATKVPLLIIINPTDVSSNRGDAHRAALFAAKQGHAVAIVSIRRLKDISNQDISVQLDDTRVALTKVIEEISLLTGQKEDVIVIGVGVAGLLAAAAQPTVSTRGVVCLNAPANDYDAADERTKTWLKAAPSLTFDEDTNILILHSKNHATLPFNHAEALAERFGKQRCTITALDSDRQQLIARFDDSTGEAVLKAIDQWINQPHDDVIWVGEPASVK